MRSAPLSLLTVVAVAHGACVNPSNPYDPGTALEDQARATVTGSAHREEISGDTGHDGITVTDGSASTVTASNGDFTLKNVVPGTVTLRFSADDHETLERVLALTAGATKDIGAVVLAPAHGALLGTVDVLGRDSNAGVTVSVANASGGAGGATVTDDSGAWQIDDVAVGHTTVTASFGSASAVAEVDVVANVTTTVEPIALDGVGPGAVFVQLAGGAPSVSDPLAVPLTISSDDASVTEARIAVDGALDDETFAAIPATVDLPATDGAHTVLVQLRDTAGNTSEVASDDVIVDRTGPVFGALSLVDPDAFVASVSVAVQVDVTGADTMILATDDDGVTTEQPQPFATAATLLLPSGDCDAGAEGCKHVCAVFLDDAGNATAEECLAITLDTQPPATPEIVEEDSFVPSAQFTLHVAAEPDDAFFDHYELLVEPTSAAFIARAPTGVDASGVAFALDATDLIAPSADPSSNGKETHRVRVRAVDRAGNISPDNAIDVVVDDVVPAAPAIAPLPNVLDVSGVATSVVNADTVQVNFLVDNPAADDATFDHYEVKTSLVNVFVPTFVLDGIIVTLIPDSQNDIAIHAVDAAGNVGPDAIVHVCEDSTPPIAPSISPLEGSVRALAVEVALVVPALDAFTCVDTAGEAQGYEVSDGVGNGFRKQPPDSDLFIASIRRNRTSDICVRGVDAAGNVGAEECAEVTEQSKQVVIPTQDGPSGADIFGDWVVANTARDGVVVRDLRNPATKIVFGVSADGNLRASGDAQNLRAVFRTGNNLQVATLPLFGGVGTATSRVFANAFSPFAADVDEDDVVFFQDLGGGTVQVMHAKTFGAGAPVALSPPFAPCPGTTPRLDGGTAVWCEAPATLHFNRLGDAAAAQRTVTTNLAPVRRGALVDPVVPGQMQQPVVSFAFIAWVEPDANGEPVLHARTPPFDTPKPNEVTTVVIDEMFDISANRISFSRIHEGLTNDIAVLDLFNPLPQNVVKLKDDLSPEFAGVIDGTRAGFADFSRGDEFVFIDLVQERWLRGTPRLAAEPVTSLFATAWVEAGIDDVVLLARELPIDAFGVSSPVIEVDLPGERVAFSGPSKFDPVYAVALHKVAYLSSPTRAPPYTLHIVNVQDPTALVRNDLVAADLFGAFAMTSDADALVYVRTDGSIVHLDISDLTAPIATVIDAPPQAAVAIDFDDGVAVAQIGGADNEQFTLLGQGQLRCASSTGGGTVLVGGVPLSMRTPKIAHLGPDFVVAFTQIGALGTSEASFCFLDCDATPTCTTPKSVSEGSGDFGVELAQDGRIGFLSLIDGLAQVVVFDNLDKRRTTLTVDASERTSLHLAVGRAVWSDASLGSRGIFEAAFP